MLNKSSWQLAVGSQQKQMAVGSWQLAVSSQQSAVGSRQLAVGKITKSLK